MKNALILEDIKESQQWLAELLKKSFQGVEVSISQNIEECKEQLKSISPDIALIDLSLPDGSGIEIIKQLKVSNQECCVVVTTIFDDNHHLFSALRAGADGYILKDQVDDVIIELLQGISNGKPPLSPVIAKKLLKHFQPDYENHAELTPREIDVLQLVGKGYSVPKVSEMLNISKNTTSGYIKTIYKKLNINSRAEASLEASKLGIVDAR